ncbi:MAG: DUF2252 family protein, partial [Candidatus Nanopelagicales bacterium]
MAKGRMAAAKVREPARRRQEAVERSAEVNIREARGRQARSTTPLADHAVFAPTALRADPVELLQRQGPSRVADLLPIRYGRMVSSPFGFYASPERSLVFDLNDFDETLPGPFEWDVKRLAASVEIAARGQSFKGRQTRAILLQPVRSYRETMHEFAGHPNQAVWYARLDADPFLARLREVVPADRARRAEALMATARTKDSMQAFRKLT